MVITSLSLEGAATLVIFLPPMLRWLFKLIVPPTPVRALIDCTRFWNSWFSRAAKLSGSPRISSAVILMRGTGVLGLPGEGGIVRVIAPGQGQGQGSVQAYPRPLAHSLLPVLTVHS